MSLLIDRIRECAQVAVQLSRQTDLLAAKLECYKRNEPLERIVVWRLQRSVCARPEPVISAGPQARECIRAAVQ
jgi:hypothetical protein